MVPVVVAVAIPLLVRNSVLLSLSWWSAHA